MPPTRWTDVFLDGLRRQGDPLADDYLHRFVAANELAGIRRIFAEMDSNDDIPPAKSLPELSEFFAATQAIPSFVDPARILRGETVFEKHAFTGALVLLTKSLPEGYAAPNLSIILNLSGNLRTHPYKRLLATLQTVVNVSSFHGFQNGGRAVITAQKLRLLHAGIRHLTHRYRPEFELRYGVPVNQEDMLGTIMGFSYLVVEGMRTLDVGLSSQEEEDFFYVWRIFALMMGIHPPDNPGSLEFIPEDIHDAQLFYEAYRRRHYVDAEKNPDGVALGHANLAMLHDFIPLFLRLLGFGILPRLLMQDLMGRTQCARIAIRPVHAHAFIRWILSNASRLLRPFRHFNEDFSERFGELIFQGLIDRAYDGQVTFTVPTDLRQLKDLIHQRGTNPNPPGDGKQFTTVQPGDVHG